MNKKISMIVVTLFFTILFFKLSYFQNNQTFSKQDRQNELHTVLNVFDTIDPRYIGRQQHAQYVAELLFLPLASFDEQARLVPLLYSDLQMEDRLVSIQFEGQSFGQERDSKSSDVVASYRYYSGLDQTSISSSPMVSIFENLENVYEKEGRIFFQLKKPEPSFPLGFFNLPILPEEMFQSESIDHFFNRWESGPYQLESFKSNRSVHLKTNPFFKPLAMFRRSFFQKVIIHLVSDSSLALNGVLSGEIDIAQHTLSPFQFDMIKKEASNYQILDYPLLSTRYLGFSMKNEHLSQASLRRQINQALDRNQLIEHVLNGKGDEAQGLFPSWLPYSLSLSFSDGSPEPLKDNLSLNLYFIDNTQNRETAQIIKSQLKEIGLDLHLKGQEQSIFFQTLEDGKADLWLSSWVGYKDPDLMNFAFHSEKVPPKGVNRGFYQKKELDQVLDQASLEFSEKKRYRLYQKAQKIIESDPPYAFLWHPQGQIAIKKNLQISSIYPDGRLIYLTQIEPLAHVEAGFNY
jgi:peptide/nickel transport system substrate-binding protein